MDSLSNNLVPENTKGKHTDVRHSKTFDKHEKALDAFKRAYKRMLNVNIWHKLSGFASAKFLLRDQQGDETNRLVEVGDYLQIDIPGPGPASGGGYDWVRVEAIEYHANPDAEEESVGMRLVLPRIRIKKVKILRIFLQMRQLPPCNSPGK